MSGQFNDYYVTSIDFNYTLPDAATLQQMVLQQQPCVINAKDNIITANVYYQDKIKAALPQMFTRSYILNQLQEIARRLQPQFGLMLFDTYRSITTQAELFDKFYSEIAEQNPQWDTAKIQQETRRFVSHPDDLGRFAISPHNSGGAVDLAIYATSSQQQLEFGTAFDELSDLSRTDFFEQTYNPQYGIAVETWLEIRHNRRLLFNLMKQAGFVNYQEEWWHYDLGDCLWASVLGCEYVYGSMEAYVSV